MDTTPHTPTTPRSPRRRRAVASVVAALGVASLAGPLAAPAPAAADGRRDPYLVTVRRCDVSACYLAFAVIDSDGDGVADADEAAADTDPQDPASIPSLPALVELEGKRMLPSFEYGRGSLLVFPAELQALATKATGEGALLAAFPLGKGRGDALSRAGISQDLLDEHGIDLDREGFTLGLGPAEKGSELPPRRIGRLGIDTVSSDEEVAPLPKIEPETVAEVPGGSAKVYENGVIRWEMDDGRVIVDRPDGTRTVTGPTVPTRRTDGEGSGLTPPTEEQLVAWARLQGAVTRTVADWSRLRAIDPEKLEDRPGVIIHVDPDQAAELGIVADVPRITTATPDVRPDLPPPHFGVGTGPGGPFFGNCEKGC